MNKKETKRKCQACAKVLDRCDLIKITKLNDGTLKVNPSSKELGRSTYVCKNPECIKLFIKKKRLKTTLKFSNPEEIEKTEKILTTLIN